MSLETQTLKLVPCFGKWVWLYEKSKEVYAGYFATEALAKAWLKKRGHVENQEATT